MRPTAPVLACALTLALVVTAPAQATLRYVTTTGGGDTGGGTSGTADTTPPILSKVSLAHTRFVLATVLRFTLSEAATLKVAMTRPHSKKALVTETLRAAAGRGKLRIAARVHGNGLKPGRYRMTVVARDAAGNASRAVHLAFQVLRRRAS